MGLDLNSALAGLVPSGIRRYTALAAATPDCVSLALGEPSEVTPEAIRAVVPAELEQGATHYAPNDGVPELRAAIASYMQGRGEYYIPEQVIVTNGATEALFSVLTALLNPGDEVLIPQPAFGLYESLVRLARACPVPLDTSICDFQLTPELLEGACSTRTKAIVLTSPNNPTGAILSAESLDAVAEAARTHDFYVICDDVYEQLVYAKNFQTFAQRHPELADCTIVVNSFSKPYAMCGWRLGWFAASEPVVEAARKVHQYAVSCLPTFTQPAAVRALTTDVEPLRQNYLKRRNMTLACLQELDMPCIEPQGAFYVFPSIERFAMMSEEFCQRAIAEGHVALVPGVFFGVEGHVRISYSADEATLKRGLANLTEFVSAL